MTYRDDIKRSAELLLAYTHDLQDQNLDEEERVAIEDCLWGEREAILTHIKDSSLYWMLPLLREVEGEWIADHEELPLGGFGEILTFEDIEGNEHSLSASARWKYAVAVEELPEKVQESIMHLGLEHARGDLQLHTIDDLVSALLGREILDLPEEAEEDEADSTEKVDWTRLGF
jgi:hypothetical protein